MKLTLLAQLLLSAALLFDCLTTRSAFVQSKKSGNQHVHGPEHTLRHGEKARNLKDPGVCQDNAHKVATLPAWQATD